MTRYESGSVGIDLLNQYPRKATSHMLQKPSQIRQIITLVEFHRPKPLILFMHIFFFKIKKYFKGVE